jgi:N-acetylglucosaminyldiphosphoundecaprenol N-acetyl-beta-D-mannosaminyltransferase
MIKILGINVSSESRAEMLEQMKTWLSLPENHYITTPNPEIILAAQKDEEYFYVLNHAAMAIPDGFGLIPAARLAGKRLERLAGSDATLILLDEAERFNYRVAIFNWKGGLSTAADLGSALRKRWPRLLFKVYDIGRDWEAPFPETEVEEFAPRLAFVTLGAPYQEKFIYHRLSKRSDIRLSLGIGGSFDFLTGKIKRAPAIFRRAGLEWLWRFLRRPRKHWLRIWRAVFVFTAKIFVWRFIWPHQYRDNVACLAYRRGQNGPEVLMVEREEEPGHWQFPQGGVDGQSLAIAAKRELTEELHSHNFEVQAVYPKLYRYQVISPGKHSGYKGQKQGLAIAEFTGQESELDINFWEHRAWRWVPLSDALSALHSVRQASGQIFLDKFEEFLEKHDTIGL